VGADVPPLLCTRNTVDFIQHCLV